MESLQVLAAATVCVCNEAFVYIGLPTCYIVCREYGLGTPALLLLILIFTYTELKYSCVCGQPHVRKYYNYEHGKDGAWKWLLRMFGLRCGGDNMAALQFNGNGSNAHALNYRFVAMGITRLDVDAKRQG